MPWCSASFHLFRITQIKISTIVDKCLTCDYFKALLCYYLLVELGFILPLFWSLLDDFIAFLFKLKQFGTFSLQILLLFFENISWTFSTFSFNLQVFVSFQLFFELIYDSLFFLCGLQSIMYLKNEFI